MAHMVRIVLSSATVEMELFVMPVMGFVAVSLAGLVTTVLKVC